MNEQPLNPSMVHDCYLSLKYVCLHNFLNLFGLKVALKNQSRLPDQVRKGPAKKEHRVNFRIKFVTGFVRGTEFPSRAGERIEVHPGLKACRNRPWGCIKSH